MNRLKRYHLGCGEPLQSQHSEWISMNRAMDMEREKNRMLALKKIKPGKRH